MKKSHLIILLSFIAFTWSSCSQTGKSTSTCSAKKIDSQKEQHQSKPHRYGGWYCPDNLGGFPPVDIANWDQVPVVKGRMPTKEEAHNGISLIYVDPTEYPDAQVLDFETPRLANYYCRPSGRNEQVIIIQAFTVGKDTIVGFRYLNGGNGSARLREVHLTSEVQKILIPDSRFVTLDIHLNAKPNNVWDIMTLPEFTEELQKSFDKDLKLGTKWRESTNLNFHYPNQGERKSSFGDVLYGSHYIQNVCDNYTEKFLVLGQETPNSTILKIACGPFKDDYVAQEAAIYSWAQKLKDLVEGC